MPYIDKNPPLLPSKPEPTGRPGSLGKPGSPFSSPAPTPAPDKENHFVAPANPKPQAVHSKAEESTETTLFLRRLKTPAGRSEIAKKLGLTSILGENAARIDNVIAGIEKKITKYGTIIDPTEKRSFKGTAQTTEDFFNAKKILATELQDHRVDIKETKARKERATVKDIIKEEFGQK